MTTKEQLIQEIEQASEETLQTLLHLWQQTKQQTTQNKLSDFFRQSPLAAQQDLDLSRDHTTYSDRFTL
jgi:two-component sensor histidine kinase